VATEPAPAAIEQTPGQASLDAQPVSGGFVSRSEDVGLAGKKHVWHNGPMPPWENTPALAFLCESCGKSFEAKRPAKYCSTSCQERSRPHRTFAPEQVKAWREQRLANPAYRARINRQTNERATAIRRWLDAYKVENGCVDCGYRDHPHALHFDHATDDKTINVCEAKSIAQAQREIAKCDVRCANCHAIKTHDRRQARKSGEK
jgi:hypothetical protein